MQCPNGHAVDVEAAFCPVCGAPVQRTDAPAGGGTEHAPQADVERRTHSTEPPPSPTRASRPGQSTIRIGERYVLGVDLPRKGPSSYYVARNGFWAMRDVRRFPMTAQGWEEAWQEFVRLEPLAAQAYSADVARAAGRTADPPPSEQPGRSDPGDDLSEGWSYIIAGTLIAIFGLALFFTGNTAVAVFGNMLVYVGAVVTLIGAIAEGVKLGMRQR
jgi:hypothetical protein